MADPAPQDRTGDHKIHDPDTGTSTNAPPRRFRPEDIPLPGKIGKAKKDLMDFPKNLDDAIADAGG